MTQEPPETNGTPEIETDVPESTDDPELILNTEIPDTSETSTMEITQLPQGHTSCMALEEVAQSSQTFDCVASTEEPCDRVDCTTEWIGSRFTAEVILLPCYIPYAVQISMSREAGVLLNKTVDHSQEIVVPDLYNLILIVKLDHFQDAVGLQVSMHAHTSNHCGSKHYSVCM